MYECAVSILHVHELTPLTSAFRYSTTWLARALPEDGTITSLEIDPHCVKVATENLTAAGLINKVNIILGRATETMETLSATPTPFDLVFIDAAKEEYATYFEHAKHLVRRGGVIVCISTTAHVGVRKSLTLRMYRSSTTLFAMENWRTQKIRRAELKACGDFSR